ncbi:MAG: sulfotransferase [Euzebyales bacterium]|nr:sulfotransferase [Euzebyales bacterium]
MTAARYDDAWDCSPSGSTGGRPPPAGGPCAGALPNVVVIGAMKCGTSALHRYLDRHPQIAMSAPKELNFFFGPDARRHDRAPPGHEDGRHGPVAWAGGNWHRGPAWYARHFPAGVPVRGESSPGYTSPSHPGVARRMAALIPDTRLVYLVRDPVERAISQYRHHRRDGTETRTLEQALLDPDSQYVSRGRYHERVAAFLAHFGRERITIVSTEELLTERRTTLRSIARFVGVDEGLWSGDLERRCHVSWVQGPRPSRRLVDRLAEGLADDAERLRQLAGREFPAWSV